jgi:hypothetical protein
MNQFTSEQEKWLTALENGKYKQGKGSLWILVDGQKCHCCLGVAYEELFPDSLAMQPLDCRREISDHKVIIDDLKLYLRSSTGMFHTDAPALNGNDCLAEANDQGTSFADIAAYIRSYPWAVFTNFNIPTKDQTQ